MHGILPQELQLSQLEEFIGVGNGVKGRAEILEGLLVADRHERCKGIAFAGTVGLGLKEGLEKFGSIGDERLGVLEDRSHGPDRSLAHVGMSVFQTRAGRGKERLDEFGFAQLAQEAEGITPDVFVGMLEIVTDTVAVEVQCV